MNVALLALVPELSNMLFIRNLSTSGNLRQISNQVSLRNNNDILGHLIKAREFA